MRTSVEEMMQSSVRKNSDQNAASLNTSVQQKTVLIGYRQSSDGTFACFQPVTFDVDSG